MAVGGAATLVAAALVCALAVASILTPPLGAGGSQAAPLGWGLVQYNFYLQEDPSSSYFVLQPLENHGGFFGALVIIDQTVTLAPARDSLLLGAGKGLAAFSNDGLVGAPELLWTITFNDTARPFGFGKSSLSFRGSNDLSLKVREIAIVGGTGKFRLAQGFALFSTYFRDPVTRFATTNITAYVQVNPLYAQMLPELHDM